MQALVVQNNAVIGNKTANFINAEKILAEYAGEKPDIIIFPEVWSTGWKPALFSDCAENEGGQTEQFLCEIAKSFNCLVIGGTYIRKSGAKLYNTCPIISPDGEVCARYDKMHLFFADEEQKFLSAGEAPLLITYKDFRIGITVCYDIRFCELYKCYNADLLVNCACWADTKANHWISLSKARAIENSAYYIGANQCGQIDENNSNLGYSLILSPWGEVIKNAQGKECAISGELDLKALRALRQKYPYKNDAKENYTLERIVNL